MLDALDGRRDPSVPATDLYFSKQGTMRPSTHPLPFRRTALGLLFLLPLIPLLPSCGGTAADPESVTQEALLSRINGDDPPVILDVRTPAEYASGHVPGAYNLEDREVPNRIQELMQLKDREIVVYCESGPRSRWVESYLKQQGFTNVKHLIGDMSAWRANGRPVE